MSIAVLLFVLAGTVPTEPSTLHRGYHQDRVTRLPAKMFPHLPSAVRSYLEKRHFTVPQSPESGIKGPHNVISGSFRNPGQIDWAVLASRAGRSRILVFWSGGTEDVAVLAEGPDEHWVQSMPEGPVYSRVLVSVGRTYIMEHYDAYGGPVPPAIDHDGINDAFAGKASGVHYYHNRTWLSLQGAD